MKAINTRLKQSLNRAFFVEPNDLGFWFLTSLFKKTTKPLKTMPFIIVIPTAFFIAFVVYLILGKWFIRLVSWLQYGF